MEKFVTLYSLKMVREKTVKYRTTRGGKRAFEQAPVHVSAAEHAYNILRALGYHEKPSEVCGVIAMSVTNEVLGVFPLFSGTVAHCISEPREVFQALLLCNASQFIVWHNHPGNTTQPSVQDQHAANAMKKAGSIMGVALLDSLIITPTRGFFSMKEHGMIKEELTPWR